MAAFNVGNNRALVPAGTVITATGVGTGFQYDNRTQFRGFSSVQAISGAGATVTVSIDTSYDNGVTDAWRSVGTFAAQTTVAQTARKSFPGLDRWVRASWTVGGTTPSITLDVAGEVN